MYSLSADTQRGCNRDRRGIRKESIRHFGNDSRWSSPLFFFFFECIDCLHEYPSCPQMPPSLLTIDHSTPGLVVLFWLKPVLLACLSRVGAWEAFFCLLIVFFCHSCFWKKKTLWGSSGNCCSLHSTLEMKLNVAGIMLPTVVLMPTFVSQSHVWVTRLDAIMVHGWRCALLYCRCMHP